MPSPLQNDRPSPVPTLPTDGPAARLAGRLYWLVTLGGWLGVAAIASSPWWMSAEWLLQLAAFQWRLAAEHTPGVLAADSLWGARGAMLLPGLAGLWGVYRLRQLLAHYRAGELFDLHAARLLRSVGLGFTAMSVLQVLSPTLAVLALTAHNPPGHRIVSVGVNFESYTLLIVGVLIVLLANVMLEATRIAQENQEFV